MGNVVAVTRNGMGDAYLFGSMTEADLCPIVQYGDVICDGPERLLRQYTRLEIPDLLRRLGDEDFRNEVLREAASPLVGWEAAMRRYSPQMWEMMQKIASPPPKDPGEIVSVIVRDRKLSVVESKSREKERPKMSNTEATEATAAEATEAPKEKKGRTKSEQPTTIGGYSLVSKITMLVDKDGKPYGPDNNPKKAGSKSAVRFALYKNGMTVEEAYKAGVAAADFAYDVNKAFIKID